jgi:hypothetical protein
LLGLAHGLGGTLQAQPTLPSLQADVQPFTDESEMCVVNAEDLWQLGGVFQLDFFAQYLSQAALRTSRRSGTK